MSLLDKWKALSSAAKEKILVVVGYIVYMVFFYFIGATKARLIDFIAISLLTGLYAIIVWYVKKKILNK